MRSFLAPGEKPPKKPPVIPVWISHGIPPRPPRKPRPLVIGKWPVEGY
jgi:hypothetical protein